MLYLVPLEALGNADHNLTSHIHYRLDPVHGNLDDHIHPDPNAEQAVETYKFLYWEPDRALAELQTLPDGVNTVNDIGTQERPLLVRWRLLPDSARRVRVQQAGRR